MQYSKLCERLSYRYRMDRRANWTHNKANSYNYDQAFEFERQSIFYASKWRIVHKTSGHKLKSPKLQVQSQT